MLEETPVKTKEQEYNEKVLKFLDKIGALQQIVDLYGTMKMHGAPKEEVSIAIKHIVSTKVNEADEPDFTPTFVLRMLQTVYPELDLY
jgi:hypothetical protein